MVARIVLLGLAVALLGADVPGEYEVKGAFIYNFAKFVEWPAGIWSGGSAFTICVAGEEEISARLREVVKGRRVSGSPVGVRTLADASQTDGCQILFATDSGAAAAVRKRSPAGVLTVGESTSFAREGGMINFMFVDKKVRFEINKKSAEAAGLSISSHLLKLAHDVYE